MNEVVVVKTGTANTASVLAALKRVGCSARLSSEAGDVAAASAVVLPGVGSFGAAMGEIERFGLVDVLRERIGAGRATLCICLGLQVLARESEESPGVRGLGVIEARVTKFGSGVRVPHMGWNFVKQQASKPAKQHMRSEEEEDVVGREDLVAPTDPAEPGSTPPWGSGRSWGSGGFAYFANSYKLDEVPAGWDGAVAVHGTRFVAVIARSGVLACQFHPELSGEWGLGLIRGWLDRTGVGAC